MRGVRMRRWIWGAVVFAATWMAWALLRALIAAEDSVLARIAAGLPSVPGIFYGWSFAWALIGGIFTTVLIAVAYIAIGMLVTRTAKPSFAAAWLTAILAGTIVGGAIDLADLIRSLGMFGLRGVFIETYDLQKAVIWALCVGWIPSLIVARGRSGARATRRSILVAVAAVVIVGAALTATVIAGDRAADAERAQADRERAEAEQTAVGILPDPEVPGEPVHFRAETSDPVPPGACTPENSTLLIGAEDAATGHRGQMIQLMNFSDEPCVVEGYPDIAFGDQNAHELAVAIEHGRSFMAEDAGPIRVEVAPQATVTAVIGWDANSTHGALVAHTLHAAIRAGEERGSWPVILDIVEGSTVAVTAWR